MNRYYLYVTIYKRLKISWNQKTLEHTIMLKEMNCQPRVVNSARILFRNKNKAILGLKKLSFFFHLSTFPPKYKLFSMKKSEATRKHGILKERTMR